MFPLTRGSICACARAISTFSRQASIPVTLAPRRARDSLSKPPPQPTSSIRRELNGREASLLSSRFTKLWKVWCKSSADKIHASKCSNDDATYSQIYPTRVGFMSCNGPAPFLPFGSHHSSASTRHFCSSSTFTVPPALNNLRCRCLTRTLAAALIEPPVLIAPPLICHVCSKRRDHVVDEPHKNCL